MVPKVIRVIIPCYNADTTIRACLESVFCSENVAMEVFVVDDGNTSALTGLEATYPITIVKTEGKQGAGSARNCGAAGFKGGVIVFIDADVKVEKHAFYRLIHPIASGGADATVGCYSNKVHGRKTADAYKQLYLAYTYSKPKKELKNTFWTALCAVRTDFFWRVDGFDTHFRGAGPEDLDLGIKLTAAGARIISVPGALGEHLASYGLFGLMMNDLRKGSEDVYVHWKKRIPLADNRHVGIFSIGAVFCAWSVMLFLFFPLPPMFHWGAVIVVGLYLFVRSDILLRGYLPSGLKMFLTAIPITFILDLIRGVAVCVGTACAALEATTCGTWRPFSRTDGEKRI